MLTVYNVKQGDSMLLAGMSGTTCCFDSEPLLIDCGLQKATVHSMIGATQQRIRVVITHADRDHIGGLYDVLLNHHVSRLYIPRYLPEILRIEAYLRNKSTRKAPRLLPQMMGRRIEVAEGDNLCSHAKVMNPPKSASKVLRGLGVESFSRMELQDAVLSLQSRGLRLRTDEIMEYTPEPIEDADVRDGLRAGQSIPVMQNRERRKFFQGFFVYLAQCLQEVINVPKVDTPTLRNFKYTGNRETDRAISSAIQLAANQVSIVFRYVGTTSFLFTGDADTSVFQRIKTHGHTLQSDYLKVPHHGSQHNLDANSLIYIAPKVAVVSHGNGKFGRDPDSHPHTATINLLKTHGITTYYTNDVRKGGKVIANATIGRTSCNYLYFK